MPVIAIARDDAFCFYYQDNLEMLQSLGCTVEYFSPLADEPVPEYASGLIIGGGYPENHLEALAANKITSESVRKCIESGMPCIAECGGFMYLGRCIDGKNMTGLLDVESSNTGHLVRFGYVTVTADRDTLLLKKVRVLRRMNFIIMTAVITELHAQLQRQTEGHGSAYMQKIIYLPDIRTCILPLIWGRQRSSYAHAGNISV